MQALREVAACGSVIDPQAVEALVRGRARLRASALKHLTPRELEVPREMAQGRGNARIAAQLHLSESSVESTAWHRDVTPAPHALVTIWWRRAARAGRHHHSCHPGLRGSVVLWA